MRLNKLFLLNVCVVSLYVGGITQSYGSGVLTEMAASSIMRRVSFAAIQNHSWRQSGILHSVRQISTLKKTKGTSIGNPCIDGVFQYGLSDSFIASNFLNIVLQLQDGSSITEVTFLPRDLPSSDPLAITGYNFTVDARCKTKDGRHFLVEMQNDFTDDYHLKALIEHSRMIGRIDLDQTRALSRTEEKNLKKKGSRKFWKGIQGIYSVVLTNKAFSEKRFKSRYTKEPLMEPDLRNTYELRNITNLSRHYGDIPNQIVLLMLANLPDKSEKDFSPLERWAYMFQDKGLRHGARKIEEIREIKNPKEVAGGDKAIERFIQRLDIRHLPQEVIDRYHSAIQYYNETILDIEERAEEKGEKVAKVEIARGMLRDKMSIAIIAKYTGLTADEIKAIK